MREVYGENVVVQRCQWDKRENIVSYLPKSDQRTSRRKLQVAYAYLAYADARRALLRLAGELREVNESAARSLKEGLDEMLMLHRRTRGLGKPETFTYMGLTHIYARSSKGKFLLQRQTMRTCMQAKLREVKTKLMRCRHVPIPEQDAWLARVIRRYFAYHAVPTNMRVMAQFWTQVIWHWHQVLRRRGQQDQTDWGRMNSSSHDGSHWRDSNIHGLTSGLTVEPEAGA